MIIVVVVVVIIAVFELHGSQTSMPEPLTYFHYTP